MNLLDEDVGYFDLTTFGLEIEDKVGEMIFYPKKEITLCGVDEVKKILNQLELEYVFYKKCGDNLEAKELFLKCQGKASKLHKAWKISQNIFEYMSGIATYTSLLVSLAKEINPHITVSTTRKNFPSSKKLMLKSVMCGGGVAHRLGLYDSILIFKEHRVFLGDKTTIEEKFATLKHKFLEKKITVEVDNFEEAFYFASIGADILQCEKMSHDELLKCVALKKEFPQLLLCATGGLNASNVQDFVRLGVDFIVTSSPYHAKPVDIKVEILNLNDA